MHAMSHFQHKERGSRTVSFSMIPPTPWIAAVSNVSIELSRYQHVVSILLREYGIDTYVERYQVLRVPIEGVIVEIRELLYSAVSYEPGQKTIIVFAQQLILEGEV